MNKDSAVLTFLRGCATISTSPVYFNFGKVKDKTHQLVSRADDLSTCKPFIDGSIQMRYTFSIDSFKSVSLNPTVAGRADENLDDIADVQAVIDWLIAQADAGHYPDFGPDCIIDDMKVTTTRPQLVTLNEEVNPPLAVYRITAEINYLDNSRRLWK